MAGTTESKTRRAHDRRLKELELLISSSRALNSTLDYDELLERILVIVRDALKVETTSILFYDAKRENMVFEKVRGKRGRAIVGLKIPIGEGVAGWVAAHEKPLIVNNLREDPRYSKRLEQELGLETRSIISIPLKRRNKMIGIIEAVNRNNDEPFTQGDLELFLALGDHIATAIDNASLYREAERRRLENSLLYKLSVSLGKSLTLDEVLEQILNSLQRLIPYDAAAIFVLDPREQTLVSQINRGYTPGRESRLQLKLDEGIVGWAARHREGTIVSDVRKDPRYVDARRRTRSEIVAPMLSRGKVIGLFNLESNRASAYGEEDLQLLEAFAAQAGVSIERARLYEEQQEKQEILRELRLARTVQQFFTPTKSRKLGGYTLAGRIYPSLELSGDYFDVFPLAKPFVAFAIADVAGKGVPASIIVSGFRATLHTAAPYFTSAHDITYRANEILMETVRPEDFVTAFIGVLDTDSGHVTYCCAGHNPAILMSPNGRYELLDTGGPVLGVFKDIDLREGEVTITDQLLFVYTDGAVDVTDPRDRPFGLDRLVTFLRRNMDLEARRICTELGRHLKDYMRGSPPLDDMTFLALRK